MWKRYASFQQQYSIQNKRDLARTVAKDKSIADIIDNDEFLVAFWKDMKQELDKKESILQ